MDIRAACEVIRLAVYIVVDLYKHYRESRMTAKGKEWRMVRLQVSTVESLRAIAASWIASEWTGAPTGDHGQWDGVHVSVDAVILELLRREHSIRERRKKSAVKRSQRLTADPDSQPTT